MFESHRNRGEGSVGYIAIVFLIATIVVALISGAAPGQVAGEISAAVCRVAGGKCNPAGSRSTPPTSPAVPANRLPGTPPPAAGNEIAQTGDARLWVTWGYFVHGTGDKAYMQQLAQRLQGLTPDELSQFLFLMGDAAHLGYDPPYGAFVAMNWFLSQLPPDDAGRQAIIKLLLSQPPSPRTMWYFKEYMPVLGIPGSVPPKPPSALIPPPSKETPPKEPDTFFSDQERKEASITFGLLDYLHLSKVAAGSEASDPFMQQFAQQLQALKPEVLNKILSSTNCWTDLNIVLSMYPPDDPNRKTITKILVKNANPYNKWYLRKYMPVLGISP